MIGISSINNIARSKKQKQFLIVFCFFALFLFLPDSFILAADSGLSWMQRLMLNIAFSVGGMFVFIGGFALDSAINVFVLNMGAMMNGNVGYVVNAVWVIIRDVFNLLFIFALIFIGLKLIWSADDSSSKRALGSLVIAALLINFSLFFAKFIVDFTNIAAIAVNDLITHVVSAEVSETGSDEDSTILFGSVTLYGIGGNLMQLMNLQNLQELQLEWFLYVRPPLPKIVKRSLGGINKALESSKMHES